jgi:formylglycine-generating enzyme required for sulfatase activity
MGFNPSRFVGDRNPVENVAWGEAKEFVRRLAEKTGKPYRLLSEAEWEYAARAGSRTAYPWGDTITRALASYYESGGTMPAGSYQPNAFGLYDTSGNVWEWVEDCWTASHAGAPVDGSARDNAGCDARVNRGGSWGRRDHALRSAYREWAEPGVRSSTLGFRVARGMPTDVPQSERTPSAGVAATPPAAAPGQKFRDCVDCPEMVPLPAGAFDMGTLDDSRDDEAQPVHRVTMSRAFAIGVREVTQAEWRAVMGENRSSYQGDRHPVENVSWNDANEYARRLSEKTGKTYRLPSEAEWEYAARAGSRAKFPWGEELDESKARSGWSRGTAPVGSYPPNAFGLFDTAGNVAEWTADCWNPSYKGSPGDGSAWMTGDCGQRTYRGGAWGQHDWSLRSAKRSRIEPHIRWNQIGLRVVREL